MYQQPASRNLGLVLIKAICISSGKLAASLSQTCSKLVTNFLHACGKLVANLLQASCKHADAWDMIP